MDTQRSARCVSTRGETASAARVSIARLFNRRCNVTHACADLASTLPPRFPHYVPHVHTASDAGSCCASCCSIVAACVRLSGLRPPVLSFAGVCFCACAPSLPAARYRLALFATTDTVRARVQRALAREPSAAAAHWYPGGSRVAFALPPHLRSSAALTLLLRAHSHVVGRRARACARARRQS